MIEHIEIKKVSPFYLKESIRVINVYSAGLIEPTLDNKFKFDLAKQLWILFNKKNTKQVVPKNNNVKLKVYEAIFLLQIIDDVASIEKKSSLYPMQESIDKQLS
jgi:hypothetical protein